MNVLALDTTARACSVAVRATGQVTCRSQKMQRGQAEALVPMLQATMADASLRYAQLDLIAVTVGPGAFTGVRIGLATARALSVATGAPCIGMTTLEVLAEQVDERRMQGHALLAVIDTKRGDVYAQTFAADRQPRMLPRVATPSEVAEWIAASADPVLIVGDGAELVAAASLAAQSMREIVPGAEYLDASVLAAIAERRWLAGTRPLGRPSPLYLRPPDTGPARPTQPS